MKHRGRRALAYPKSVCGRDRAPSIAVVSLHKWNAVMQFNGLVLGGTTLPAFVKWFIEDDARARRRRAAGSVALWDAVEAVNVFLGRFLF